MDHPYNLFTIILGEKLFYTKTIAVKRNNFLKKIFRSVAGVIQVVIYSFYSAKENIRTVKGVFL